MRLRCEQCGYVEEPFATGYLWVNTTIQLANGRTLPDWRQFAVAVCSEFCAVALRRDNKIPSRFVCLDGSETAVPEEQSRPHELRNADEDQERSASPPPTDDSTGNGLPRPSEQQPAGTVQCESIAQT